MEIARGTWTAQQKGQRPFSEWGDTWWELWSSNPDLSPNTIEATRIQYGKHVRPSFEHQQIRAISPTLVRRWQNRLQATTGWQTVMASRSILIRVLELAEDDGAISSNPVRKVSAQAAHRPRGDPGHRQAAGPHAGGGRHPAGLLPGLLVGSRHHPARHRHAVRRARRPAPAPGRPLTPLRAGGRHVLPGRPGRQWLQEPPQERSRHPRITRSPTRSTTRSPAACHPAATPRTRSSPAQAAAQAAAAPARSSARRPARHQDGALPPQLPPHLPARRPARPGGRRAAALEHLGLGHLDLRGPHDLRHAYSTWLEEEGIPVRVIDELMGHSSTRRPGAGAAIGRMYRETTPAMAARVVAVLERRLDVVLKIAWQTRELLTNGQRRSAP